MADRIEDFAVNSARWLSLEDFEGEVWKDIPDYEGWYQVSNMGRIRSLDREFVYSRKCDSVPRVKRLKSQIIKASSYGLYLICHLKKMGTSKAVKYHRIVCSVFHGNPHNLPEVNHKNEQKTDNRASNLEFCTRQYNATYGTAIQRVSAKTRNHPNTSRPVFQYTENCVLVKRYPSIKQAVRETGLKESNIACVCRDGKCSTAGGFIWSHSDDPSVIAKKALRKVKNGVKYEKRPVLMFTMDGDFVREFSSIVDASKITGAPKDSISRCCKHERYKSAGGYKWEYK